MIDASVWTEKLAYAGVFARGRSLVKKTATWRTSHWEAVRHVCGVMFAASLVLVAVSVAHAVVVTDDFSDGTDGAAAILAPPASNPAPGSPPNVTGPIWTHLNGELVSSDQTWDATTGELRMKAPDNGYIADAMGSQYGFTGSYVGTSFNDFSVSI